jgi:hypothetical protein
MMTHRDVLLVPAFLLLITSCATDRPDDSLSRITDSAGVAIVSGPADDVPLPWTLREIRRLGGADTGAQAFTRVSPLTVATDAKRLVAVLDWDGGNRIHVFDSSGTWIRSLGGKGSGPGEMQEAQGLAMSASGGLTVHDYMKSALLQWAADGTVMSEARIPSHRGYPATPPRVRGDTMFITVETNDSTVRIRRFERWTAADTIALDSTAVPRPKMVRFACIGMSMPPLFTGDLMWTLGAGSVTAVTHQSHYVVDVRDGRKLIRSIRRDFAPIVAKPTDASKLYPEGVKVRFGGGNECVIPSAEFGEKIGVAPTIPVVRAMRFAPDGTLWVERFTFEGEAPATDVFDRDGNYLGTLAGRPLPLGFLGTDVVLFPIVNADDDTSVLGLFHIERAPAKR